MAFTRATLTNGQKARIKIALLQWHEAQCADGPGNREYHEKYSQKHFSVGGKYIRLDVGTSGAFMVDIATGTVYGIKGYGKVDKKKVSGNLWSDSFDGAVFVQDPLNARAS